MAKKTYVIKQQRKFNGDVTVATITYECDEAEIAGFLSLLDGKLTVLVEDVTLSSPEAQSDVVTGGLPIESIAMVHSEAKTKYVGAYNRAMLFKATTSVVELQNLLKTHKPFGGTFAAELPDAVYPKVSDFSKL
jgi:hypothetical protein